MTERPAVRGSVPHLLLSFGITTVFGPTELPLFRHFPDDFLYVFRVQESGVRGIARLCAGNR